MRRWSNGLLVIVVAIRELWCVKTKVDGVPDFSGMCIWCRGPAMTRIFILRILVSYSLLLPPGQQQPKDDGCCAECSALSVEQNVVRTLEVFAINAALHKRSRRRP